MQILELFLLLGLKLGLFLARGAFGGLVYRLLLLDFGERAALVPVFDEDDDRWFVNHGFDVKHERKDEKHWHEQRKSGENQFVARPRAKKIAQIAPEPGRRGYRG